MAQGNGIGTTDRPLAGKVALVTGASRGLGAATARRLARLGADVAIGYRSRADQAVAVVDEIKGLGVRAEAFAADLSVRTEATGLADRAAGTFGGIDIVVNSAAVFLFGELSDADRDRMRAINVEGVAAVTRAALKYVPDGGRIINIGSVAGSRSVIPGVSDYAAAKAAVAAYTRSWAHDLAPRKITVNTVEVGFAQTDMVIPAESELGQGIIARIPMGRYARADEVAAAVAFLAGPDAGYVTGSSLRIDGGWDA